MKTENWKKVKELLNEVLPLETSAREKLFEKSAISGEIRKEVESLLMFEKESESLMHLSAVEILKDFIDSDDENTLIGQDIGVYKIVRELGYGGMGAVYLAERTDGKFEQKVALKLLKREMNTAALRRRFTQEREILASLEHPNIARLLDAGTTDDKIPFIAMEYVEGLPIDDYCNRHALDLNQRLDLFREVCAAVDFAHRNLVVHRDLKPSNILVNEDGTPKLLDFGISKIVSNELENADLATVTKMGAMTTSYASPEQLQNKSVTTATDVYSLGVILFELLSGHRPFESKETDLKEIYKAVIESDPPLPSAVAQTFSKQFNEATTAQFDEENVKPKKESSETVADSLRHTNPQIVRLNSQNIRGDLDNIILKALRKEPERRYSSAENFSEDIKRHLRGLPVTARPNTFSYRTSKFINRNKASVFAGMLIFLAIGGGIIATLWQSGVARAESERARSEAEKAEKINAYLQNVLNFSNPHWLSSNPEKNRNATISEAIDAAAEKIEIELKDEPEIQAEIQFTLGKTYIGQGQIEKAERNLRSALSKFIQIQGENSVEAMQTNVILADTLYLKGDYQEAEILYLKAIEYFRGDVDKKETPAKWLAIATIDLGNIEFARGNFTQAIALYNEGLDNARTLTEQDRWVEPIVLANLGYLKLRRGNVDEALDKLNQAEQILKSLSDEPKLDYGNVQRYLGILFKLKGNYSEAEKRLIYSHEILVKNLGEESQYTTYPLVELADTYYLQKEYEKAESTVKKAFAIQQKLHKKDHRDFTLSMTVLGKILSMTDRIQEGEKILLDAINMEQRLKIDKSDTSSETKIALAENYIAQKKFDKAEDLLINAKNNLIKTVNQDHPNLIKCEQLLKKIDSVETKI